MSIATLGINFKNWSISPIGTKDINKARELVMRDDFESLLIITKNMAYGPVTMVEHALEELQLLELETMAAYQTKLYLEACAELDPNDKEMFNLMIDMSYEINKNLITYLGYEEPIVWASENPKDFIDGFANKYNSLRIIVNKWVSVVEGNW